MIFRKFLGPSSKTGNLQDLNEKEVLAHIERLEMAFFQVSSVFRNHKDLKAFLEVISRESLNCLRANRSTIFLIDPKNEILKPQFIHALDPRYQQTGVVEEKEIAKKTLRQNKPLLLQKPEDFSDLFKYEERDNKITSLMSLPLMSKGKGIGVFSVVRINEEYGFDEKSLRFFSSFANFAFTAGEIADLLEEVEKGKSLRITYERYLDNIMNVLQGLSQREQQRIDSHIVILQSEQKVDEKEFFKTETNEKIPWAQGFIFPKENSAINRRKDERIEVTVRVEFDEEYWGLTQNLSNGGAFILTPNPMDLGDEFLLKLHIANGGEPVEVACKVVWTNIYGKETEALRRGMGVKFLELRPEDQNRIQEYINNYNNNRDLPSKN